MQRSVTSLTLFGALILAGCGDDDVTNPPVATTFTVTIENVSTPGLLSTARANGTVPLSAGVYAVFSGADPMFTVGAAADAGTELIAEDGVVSTKEATLANVSGILSGTFDAPGGPDNGPAIFAGETATFTITAFPGDRLQIETMFVQSGDWFYAFGNGGLLLFDGDTPIAGEVTSELVLYDAGTEIDEAPGMGQFQKPVQAPTDTDIGPDDPTATIRLASTSGFAIPATASVIKVTITPQ